MRPIFKLLFLVVEVSAEVRAASHPTRVTAAERRLDRAELALGLIARNGS